MLIIFLTTPAWADCMPLSLDEVSEQARVLMSQGEAKLALQKVNEAIESFPCRTELIRADDLGELYQTGGTAARQAGDAERATSLYQRAARMVAPVEFYGSLGDIDAQRYATELETAATLRTDTLVLQSMVYVDGYELHGGVEQRVVAGDHLVQQLSGDGSLRSTVITVVAGEPYEIGERTHEPRSGRKVAVGITGLSLVLGGGACLVDAGIHRESLGRTIGRQDVRDDIEHSWPGFDAEETRLQRTSMALQVCGVAGISLGSTLLGGSLLLGTNSINFVKTW